MLSDDQRTFHRDNGYLAVEDVFDADELATACLTTRQR